MTFSLLWAFLIYWLILFATLYMVVEYAQNYLYDETVKRAGLRVLAASAMLAALLLWTRTQYDTMLTSDIPQTIVQGMVWFAVFALVLQFQPQHAISISLPMMLLVAGLASMAVNSMVPTNQQATPRRILRPNNPVRQTGPARRYPGQPEPTAPSPDAKDAPAK